MNKIKECIQVYNVLGGLKLILYKLIKMKYVNVGLPKLGRKEGIKG